LYRPTMTAPINARIITPIYVCHDYTSNFIFKKFKIKKIDE